MEPTTQTRETQPTEWMTIKDIAAELGVSYHTAFRWSKKGGWAFPTTYLFGTNTVRVRRKDFNSWVRHCRQRS